MVSVSVHSCFCQGSRKHKSPVVQFEEERIKCRVRLEAVDGSKGCKAELSVGMNLIKPTLQGFTKKQRPAPNFH